MTALCESLLAHAATDDTGALPPALAEHVATCAGCQRLMAQLASTAAPSTAIAEPDAGFATRAEIGAQRLLDRRRRGRIAWATTGGAALAAVGVWAAVASRAPDAPAPRSVAAITTPAPPPDRAARRCVRRPGPGLPAPLLRLRRDCRVGRRRSRNHGAPAQRRAGPGVGGERRAGARRPEEPGGRPPATWMKAPALCMKEPRRARTVDTHRPRFGRASEPRPCGGASI